jgi:hypothetical protein
MRRGLDAAGDHQADVHVRTHAVAAQGVDDAPGQLLAAESDIHVDRPRAFIQAIQMLIEEGQAAVVQAQALPYAIAEHEAAVEHRHARLVAWKQFAVDADPDRFVARIAGVVVGAFAHRCLPAGTAVSVTFLSELRGVPGMRPLACAGAISTRPLSVLVHGLLKTAPCGIALPFHPSGHVRVKSMVSGSSVSWPVLRSIVAKRTLVASAP